MNSIGILTGFVVFLILAMYCFYKWFEVFNGPDGERYCRMRTQGPFAPLTQEDIEQDQQRITKRKIS